MFVGIGYLWRSRKISHTTWFVVALVLGIWSVRCAGQSSRTPACAAFSVEGTAATGTIRGGDLETRLMPLGSPVKVLRASVGDSTRCEAAFSKDGRWLATVVTAKKLTVLITDRASATLESRFESDWNMLQTIPSEVLSSDRILGGFSEDGSLMLWRYVPQRGTNQWEAPSLRVHLQRWSIRGDLVSDEDLGVLGYEGGGREPISAEEFERIWIPGGCGRECFRGMRFDSGHLTTANSINMSESNGTTPINLSQTKSFLSVSGEQTKEQAVLFDYSGKVNERVSLPYFPNLLVPFAVDWFYPKYLVASSDEQIAVVGRKRVAWVFIDTDRDWGSEVVLLQMQPLKVLATLKTGAGGIGALAVDHRDRSVRLLGFWKDQWHDLSWNAASPSRWKNAP